MAAFAASRAAMRPLTEPPVQRGYFTNRLTRFLQQIIMNLARASRVIAASP